MDKEIKELQVEVGLLKLMLGTAYGIIYKTAKLTPEQIADFHKVLLKQASESSLVSSKDAAISDMLSAEIEDRMRGFLRAVEAKMGLGP